MSKQSLQHFELDVLLAMLRHGGESYSVPLVLALEERTGRPVAQAAVFIALSRLERKGLATSRLDDHALGTGRVRRYFKPTRQALRLLKEVRRAHARQWEGLDSLLGKA